jgi:hypothetical protein
MLGVSQIRGRGRLTLRPLHHPVPGTLPAEWAAQPLLAVIDVSQNGLEGPLPVGWAPALAALQRLDASGNGRLNGTLPSSWAGLASLQVL